MDPASSAGDGGEEGEVGTLTHPGHAGRGREAPKIRCPSLSVGRRNRLAARAPPDPQPPRAEAAAAVSAGEGDGSGSRSGMDAGSSPARQPEGAEEPANGFIEPADHDEFDLDPEPGFDPVAARIRRAADAQAEHDARIDAQYPPRATSPDAPPETRSPWALERGVYAHRYGWDNAWADTPWTPPDWMPGVEVRDSRR